MSFFGNLFSTIGRGLSSVFSWGKSLFSRAAPYVRKAAGWIKKAHDHPIGYFAKDYIIRNMADYSFDYSKRYANSEAVYNSVPIYSDDMVYPQDAFRYRLSDGYNYLLNGSSNRSQANPYRATSYGGGGMSRRQPMIAAGGGDGMGVEMDM